MLVWETYLSISHWGLFVPPPVPGKDNWLEVPLKNSGKGWRLMQNFYEARTPACYQHLDFGPDLP